VCFVLRSG